MSLGPGTQSLGFGLEHQTTSEPWQQVASFRVINSSAASCKLCGPDTVLWVPRWA